MASFLGFVALLCGGVAAAPQKTGAPEAAPSWACALADAPKTAGPVFDPSLPPWGMANGSILNFHSKSMDALNTTAERQQKQKVTAVDATSLADLIAEGNKTGILVVFYAPWCPHCHDFVLKGNDNAEIEILNRNLMEKRGPKVVKFNVQLSAPPAQFDVQFIPKIYAVTGAGTAVKYGGDPHNLQQLQSFAVARGASGTSPATTVLAARRPSKALRLSAER